MLAAMDVAELREKAARYLRIARGLSWNNPQRVQLTNLAERFVQEAKDLELQTTASAPAVVGEAAR